MERSSSHVRWLALTCVLLAACQRGSGREPPAPATPPPLPVAQRSVATSATPPAVAAADGWQRVELRAGLSVEVPAGWVRVGDDQSWGAPHEAASCRYLFVLPAVPVDCDSGVLEIQSLAPRHDSRALLPNHLRVTDTRSGDVPPFGAVTYYRGLLEGSAAIPRAAPVHALYVVALTPGASIGFQVSAPTAA